MRTFLEEDREGLEAMKATMSGNFSPVNVDVNADLWNALVMLGQTVGYLMATTRS